MNLLVLTKYTQNVVLLSKPHQLPYCITHITTLLIIPHYKKFWNIKYSSKKQKQLYNVG